MPALREKLGFADWLIKTIGSIAGLVAPPAALVLLGKLPDQMTNAALIVLPLITVAAILALIILGGRIGKLSPLYAAGLSVACAAAGALLTVAYSQFTFGQVVGIVSPGEGAESPDREIKPLRPTEEIQNILNRYEGDYAEALLRRPEMRGLMRSANQSATALIWLLMVCAQLLMVAAIVGGAWWLAEQDSAATPRRRSRRSGAPGSPKSRKG